MKKFNVVAASAVALSAALASGSALAHGTLATSFGAPGPIKYNAAAVTAAGGTITVPWSGVASAVYTVTPNAAAVTALNPTGTTSLEVNSRFTVSLPTGFTFFSQPALTVGGSTASTSISSGGINSQTVTFQIGTASGPGGNVPVPSGGGTLTLTQVSVQGATALETPGTALSITVQAINNSLVANNDSATVSATNPTFLSTTGVTASFTAPVATNFIDLRSPALGTKFVTALVDSVNADVGTIQLTQDGSLGANGSVQGVASTDTATLTINGFFNGISGAFATVGGSGCGGTVTSAGTATAASVSIPAATISGATNDICITANGTTLLSPNGNLTVAYAPGAGVTDFLGGTVTNAGDAITYTGGSTVQVTNFLTGSDAGYTSLVRLNNPTPASNNLFAVAQPYSGGPALIGTLGSIGAGMGTVYTEAQIGTATGLSLANSGARATLTIIATPGGVAAGGLLVNPGGIVDQVNQ